MKCTICGKEAKSGQTFTMTPEAKKLYKDTFNTSVDDEGFVCQECCNDPDKALDTILHDLFDGLGLPEKVKQSLIEAGKAKFNSFIGGNKT